MDTNNTDGVPPKKPRHQQTQPFQPTLKAQRNNAKRMRRGRAKRMPRLRRSHAGGEDGPYPKRLAWPILEGARRMGIGRTSVYKLAAEGNLRLIKIAGRTLIPDSEIVRLVEGD
jgi:hypothetical protein